MNSNQQSKVRNTVADLNWYCYRFVLIYRVSGWQVVTPRDALQRMREKRQLGHAIPRQIREILEWWERAINIKSDIVDDFCTQCWIFLHGFDNELKNRQI